MFLWLWVSTSLGILRTICVFPSFQQLVLEIRIEIQKFIPAVSAGASVSVVVTAASTTGAASAAGSSVVAGAEETSFLAASGAGSFAASFEEPVILWKLPEIRRVQDRLPSSPETAPSSSDVIGSAAFP